jgi:hypothetical protein
MLVTGGGGLVRLAIIPVTPDARDGFHDADPTTTARDPGKPRLHFAAVWLRHGEAQFIVIAGTQR